ncbi:MAG: glycosyltransferase family 4 protein [Terriglobales bacterium]
MRILVNDFSGHPFQIQLSRELARAGHTVLHTYFSANNTPKGSTSVLEHDPPNFAIEGLKIAGEFKKHSVMSRVFGDLAYGNVASARVRQFRPDVVLSSNMPLDAQRLLLRAVRDVNARLVFWLQDLLSVGIEFALRRKRVPFAGCVGLFYRRLEQRLLRASDAVVCIAPEFHSVMEKWRIDSPKTFVIENWAPLNEVTPRSRNTAWAKEQGLAGKFCFMYSGTLGMKHSPELLLHLARHFQARKEVVTAVIAEGPGADWLRRNAHRVRPGALVLLPFQPYDRLSEVLASSDVLITLLDRDGGAFAVPSKTLAYLCAGRPQLVSAPECNLAARIVQRAVAGESVPPDPQPLLEAAERMLQCEPLRQRYAANARSYAENTFQIEEVTQRFLEVFHFVLGKRSYACSAPNDSMPLYTVTDAKGQTRRVAFPAEVNALGSISQNPSS